MTVPVRFHSFLLQRHPHVHLQYYTLRAHPRIPHLRRARKKSSHAAPLVPAAESPVRSDGLTESEDMVKNAQMDLKCRKVESELMDAGQSVAQELTDSSRETTCRSDQTSLMDAGIAGVSVAQELMDPYHRTACSSDQNSPTDGCWYSEREGCAGVDGCSIQYGWVLIFSRSRQTIPATGTD